MLIITHDLQLATGLCDSLAVMYSGEMIEFGKKCSGRSEASLYPGTITVAAGKRYASHEGLRSRARRTDRRM